MISVTDDGLLRGDGVFEALRLYSGRPFALDEHMARMRRSAENLRLPLDVDLVEREALALIEAAGPIDAAVRLVATRGGRRIGLLEALPDLPPTLGLGCVTYAPTRVLDRIKSLSYAANMLCSRLARERGFDEALLVTPHGRILEAPTASFFWVAEGRVHTPPLDDHLLDSITRRTVIECVDVVERPVTLDELRGAQEAYLGSSLREVMPVHAIEDITLTAPGPVTTSVGSEVARHIAARVDADR